MRGMHIRAITVLAVGLCWVGASMAAGGAPQPARTLQPTDGVYYDPNQSGTALTLQKLGEDAYFGSLNSYDEAGRPTWYIFNSVVDGGASVNAELLSAQDGQCLGCPHANPTVAPSGKTIEITPINAFSILVKHGNVESKMVRTFPNFNQRYPGNSAWFAVFEATLRIPQADNTDKVFTGDVHGFAVPLTDPIDDLNDPNRGIAVFGLWCHNSRCYDELGPIFDTAVPPSALFAIPVVTWDAPQQTANLHTMYRTGQSGSSWLNPTNGFDFDLERVSATEMQGEGQIRDPDSGQVVDAFMTLTLIRQMP